MLPLSILTFSFKRFFTKLKYLAKCLSFTTSQNKLNHQCSTISEKAMAPYSSTLAWKIPWVEEPGRLQSMGLWSRTRLSDFTFTFHCHALEKEMAWRIPGMAKPGGLPSMRSHRVGHDWSNLAASSSSSIGAFINELSGH